MRAKVNSKMAQRLETLERLCERLVDSHEDPEGTRDHGKNLWFSPKVCNLSRTKET